MKYLRKYKGQTGKWIYVYKTKSGKHESLREPTKKEKVRSIVRKSVKVLGTGLALGAGIYALNKLAKKKKLLTNKKNYLNLDYLRKKKSKK